jgi:5-methylthioadenosine/S-adenosylhomocysteine deaminase
LCESTPAMVAITQLFCACRVRYAMHSQHAATAKRAPVVKAATLCAKDKAGAYSSAMIAARDLPLFPAWEVLRMATIEGARAIGLGEEVGSLEAGKQADLILVDLKALNLSPVLEGPVRNIVPNLVYAASGHEVRTVMVSGKILVRDRQVLTADEEAVRAEAQVQAEMVAQQVAADPIHKGMALLEAMEAGQL